MLYVRCLEMSSSTSYLDQNLLFSLNHDGRTPTYSPLHGSGRGGAVDSQPTWQQQQQPDEAAAPPGEALQLAQQLAQQLAVTEEDS